MPKRTDIRKVLVVGAGPTVIGQGGELDHAGAQAIRALREDGVQVVVLHSNPASAMTGPELAHRTYLEPITVETAERVIAQERPDALLPTLGGWTAFHLTQALAERGILAQYGVKLIGASFEAIRAAEHRRVFHDAMRKIGVPVPKGASAHTLDEAMAAAEQVGLPAMIRPVFVHGAGKVAPDRAGYEAICRAGLAASPVSTIWIEESLVGWKELELEAVRDAADHVLVLCAIENVDPIGVHSGDSIAVAPAQTVDGRGLQRLHDVSRAMLRELRVEGSATLRFAMNPADGRFVAIGIAPRPTRSSALASKAIGRPIARIASKLALGDTLDTVATFEPVTEHVVVKIPRFDFEKFPGADRTLTTTMRSVGEAMAIGRTFAEAYMKALRSLECGRLPLEPPDLPQALQDALKSPHPDRPWFVAQAFREGWSVAQVHALTAIDPWFLRQIEALVHKARVLESFGSLEAVSLEVLRGAKADGFSDRELARLWGTDLAAVRARREALGTSAVLEPVGAGRRTTGAPASDRSTILVLGSGPHRIGQGLELDGCCMDAASALREAGFRTVMVNCAPTAGSADFDRDDVAPLTAGDVLEIAARERPVGVLVQFGGQTPLRLARTLEEAGLPILGTTPDAIDRAEDRARFAAMVAKLGLQQPPHGVARSIAEAREVAARIGFPVMVRPSWVLGGRAIEVVHDADDLERFMREAVRASPEHPVLIDRFLENAVEVEVELVRDRAGNVFVAGVLEHIEEAGVHSGDAACTLPPHSLSPEVVERIKDQSAALAGEIGVVGLLNVQFATQGKSVFVLEANPFASRTVPFVSRATGVPLAKVAALCMTGQLLPALGCVREAEPKCLAVKESVFPFDRFPGVDVLLGPEMKSTGEVMGMGRTFEEAFAKSQLGAGVRFPAPGMPVFLSVKDADKPAVVDLARRLRALGHPVLTTSGTQRYLAEKRVPTESVLKVKEGRPNIVDRIVDGKVGMVINTTAGKQEIADSFPLRRAALVHGVPYYTTVQGARMAVGALELLARGPLGVRPLQEILQGDGQTEPMARAG
ncbi:MAG: carbamoyl-phosphate synthase large subunit [Myxococcaceae bacterium]|nr:carbamoyl-phosphate synthase large subunit [Myxococcaceae bacterium]